MARGMAESASTLVLPPVASLLEAIVGGEPAVLRRAEQAVERELRDNPAGEAVRGLARQVHQLAYYFETEVGDAAAAGRISALLRRVWPHVFPKLSAGGVDARVQAALRKQHAAQRGVGERVSDGLRPAAGAAVGLRRAAGTRTTPRRPG